jgi:CRP/FNR family transcriptional regulator, anaerobic regulatory protein
MMSVRTEIARFTAFASLHDTELLALKELAGRRRAFGRGDTIQLQDDDSPALFLLLSGWTASTVNLAGGARQMLKVHLPGDMLGLPSLPLTRTIDTLVALTDVELCSVPERALRDLFEKKPRLAALLFLITQEERVTLIDRLTVMGRTEGGRRVAALILQLYERLRRNDPQMELSFRVPLTQADVGDLIGMTMVHVSRIFQQLRTDDLVSWSRGVIAIPSLDRLRDYCGLPARQLVWEPDWLPRGD